MTSEFDVQKEDIENAVRHLQARGGGLKAGGGEEECFVLPVASCAGRGKHYILFGARALSPHWNVSLDKIKKTYKILQQFH